MILITGPTGFLGKHLIKYCIEKNIKFILLIKNLKDLNRINSQLKFKNIINKFIIIKNLNKKNILKKNNVKIVINTVTKYQKNNNSFKEIYKSNFEFPKKLYKICNQNNIKYFVNIDTILHEKTNFYTLTKFFFRKFMICTNYSLNMSVINIRFHNFFSFNENDNNIISKLIKCSKNNNIIKLTKGKQKKDFIHIDDSINFIFCILKNKINFKLKKIYNFDVGSGKSYSIRNIANLIRNKYNSDQKLNKFIIQYSNQYEKINYYSSIKKLKKEFNWSPENYLLSFFKKN